MGSIGNMPMSLKLRKKRGSKPVALAVPEASADSVVAVRDSLMVTERIGIRPTVAKDSPEVMPVVSPISSNRCSGIGQRTKLCRIPWTGL